MSADTNNLAFWFPLIASAGLPVPRTIIVETDAELVSVLDGEKPEGWDELVSEVAAAAEEIGFPCFLRTGHGSGKHDWGNTCHLSDPAKVGWHIGALVEWSVNADMLGLPTQTWAVRELLATTPLFRCEAFEGFPVVREFRFFVRDGSVEHIQPYWPEGACEQGRPDDPEWKAKLAAASALTAGEKEQLSELALRAGEAVGGGYWSVDLLQAADGDWFLTDMADGERSFRYQP